ncbi:MAG: hypothetical protein IJQ39_07665 [Thermoguttaceae bacterium]|nr:hypothetical protein [Thermoguttaceae bacterium]
MFEITKFCRCVIAAALVVLLTLCGCGTMKTTNTKRTATEQLLVSDAVDRAIDEIDFSVLAGKSVFLDSSSLADGEDSKYLSSSIRQQILSCGAYLKEKKDDADYVVELRAGALGTDEQQIIYGIPELTVPTFVGSATMTIPEISVAKKVGQRATAKIAVFAYNRKTGFPLWQSGSREKDSNVRSLWVLGGGPYRTGDIIDKPELCDQNVNIPLADMWDSKERDTKLNVCDQAFFVQNNYDGASVKGKPVIRLRNMPDNLRQDNMIAQPEGINIPTEEQRIAFEEQRAKEKAEKEAKEKAQPEGKTPEEASPKEVIATAPDSGTIK